MKEGWKEVTIGDLGRVVTGNTPPKKDPANYGGKYPFIKPTDMKIDRRHVNQWEETYSEKAFKKYKNSFIPPNSTGVVTIGTVGEKIFQADRWCFTNQSVNVVIPDQEKYDPDFVYYILKINLPKVENANPGTASGRHHVSKSNFCAIKIWVPESRDIQRKIAAILSAYDDLIENNLKRIKLLEEKAQLTYEEWFVHRRIGNKIIPDENIEYHPLSDLIERFINGGWGQEEIGGNYLNEAYVIRGTDMPKVSKGQFDDLPLRFHTESNLKSRIMEHGDIAIEMSNGNIDNVGRSFYCDESILEVLGKPLICASFCKLVKPKTAAYSLIIDAHLKYIYKTDKMLIYKAQAANGINNFNFDEMIHDEEILIPRGEGFLLFIKNLETISKGISNIRLQNNLLKEARDILLPRLMTGMIDVEKLDLSAFEQGDQEGMLIAAEPSPEYKSKNF